MSSCQKSATTPPLFTRFEAVHTGVGFSNDLIINDSINILNYIYAFNGGGVGVGDLNNDGLEDLVFSGNRVPSKVYLNLGDFKFRDITDEAGIKTNRWCAGISLVDINADGFLDIYFSIAGSPHPALRRNLLYINNGKGQFEEAAEKWGLADSSYTTQAAFFDYDKDGDLDLYLLNHANDRAVLNTPLPKKSAGESPSTDRLYRNNGDETFSDVSTAAGITIEGYGLGVAISDINNDGWPDIYVSNDFISNDLLYLNSGDGTFSNVISDAIREQSYNGMGNDLADFNNDGLVDIIVMDMLSSDAIGEKMMAGQMTPDKFMSIRAMGYEDQFVRNTLQLNQREMNFSEIGRFAGIHRTDWSWAPLFVDLDNDGWKDIYVTNGYLRDITNKDFIDYNNNLSMFKSEVQANREGLVRVIDQTDLSAVNFSFRNNGDLTFENTSEIWFDQQADFSNGAAYGDLDNDGDLDLVVNTINGQAKLFRNESQRPANYLQVVLVGAKLNPYGIGAKVSLSSPSGHQSIEQSPSRGFMSTVSSVLHFGLGTDTVLYKLEVIWPDGKISKREAVKSNQRLVIDYSRAIQIVDVVTEDQLVINFLDRTTDLGMNVSHQIPDYPDFKLNPLFPYRRSSDGFELAAGDYDGNGMDDLFVGNDEAHLIYYQQPGGDFIQKLITPSKMGRLTDVISSDINGDQIDDLVLLTHDSLKIDQSHIQLFFGRSDRSFVNHSSMLPYVPETVSAIALADYDGDSDVDLLLSESTGSFQSQLRILRNDPDTYADVTVDWIPSLPLNGRVTDLEFADYNGDDRQDIIVIGEWMEPVFLSNNGKGYDQDFPISDGTKMSGLWRTVDHVDMDADGDVDLLLGNLGLNTGYDISEDRPVKLYLSDLNSDDLPESLMTYYVQDKETFQPSRNTLLRRYPFLTRSFPNHMSYAQLYPQELIEQYSPSMTLSAQTSASYYLENVDGKFVSQELPQAVQLFSLGVSIAHDVNSDGKSELLLAGGFSLAEEDGRSYGRSNPVLLSLDKDEWVPSAQLPFHVNGDITAMVKLRYLHDQELIAVAISNEGLRVFQYCPDKKCALE